MSKVLLLFAFLFACAPVADGQGYLHHCSGEIFKGPVRSVRSVQTLYVEEGGQWVEGPRRLVGVTVYSEGRRRAEHTSFDEEGQERYIHVRVCREDGRQAEYAAFDAARNLIWRYVYSGDGREVLKFDADGRLTQREVSVHDAQGRNLAGGETFDGEGRLLLRSVITREADRTVRATYDATGRLVSQTVHTLDGGEPRHEFYTFRPDGTVARRVTSRSDAGSRHIQKESAGHGGALAPSHSERREYDAHGNLVRLINYRVDPATGEMVPFAVSYHEITYF